MIILYLFTAYGIFVWDEYPSHQACLDTRVELTEWFSRKENTQDLFSIECINPDAKGVR